MNNNNLPSPTFGFKGYFQQYWPVAMQASKAYRIIMLATLLVNIAVNLSFMQSIRVDNPVERQEFFIHATLDTLVFLFICHFVIRTYLRLKIINHPFTTKKALFLCLLLMALATLYFGLSFMLGKTDALSSTELGSIQMVNESGKVDAQFSLTQLYIMGILNSFLFFFGWSVVYLFWHQIKARKAAQKQLQKAQMQQLTNQLSPHFLFNTFNSIRALIYEDQNKAADTVTELSELFRTHLQAHLRVKSTLEEEWQVTQRYLGIEQIRLEERLTVDCQIDEQLWQQNLPTLTLLTLIENATKHGISPSTEEGFVRIIATAVNDKNWSLTITNSYKPGSNTSGTKVGLVNVKSRLGFMFGESFQFKQSSENNEFEIAITLPLGKTNA